MKTMLILGLVALVIMAVISLIRGIAAFLTSTRIDLERQDAAGPSAMQLQQNRMMFSRIKYQFAAILVVVVLLALSH